MVRKRSQIVSFNLLNYPFLLSTTVILMTPPFINQTSSTQVGSAHLRRESPKHKSSAASPTPRGRGSDEELGEGHKINLDSIWQASPSETQTTVYASDVFPSVPLHSLRDEPHKWPQLWTGTPSPIILLQLTDGNKLISTATRIMLMHQGNTLSVHIGFSAGEH